MARIVPMWTPQQAAEAPERNMEILLERVHYLSRLSPPAHGFPCLSAAVRFVVAVVVVV